MSTQSVLFKLLTYTGQERRFLFDLFIKLIRKYLSTYKNMKMRNDILIICKKPHLKAFNSL